MLCLCKKKFHHEIKAVNEFFFLKIDGLQFVMKWSFQLVGIRQHNIQDKVTKLNSTTVLADKMISVPAYSSKEFSWWNAFIWEISYAMCYLYIFLTSYSCWAFASYFATHLYPRSSFYTVPDLTSIRAVITASCSVLYGRLAAALPTYSFPFEKEVWHVFPTFFFPCMCMERQVSFRTQT